ncbi:MAG: hypothetical protein Q7U74_11195, partial [Saprospiraceae bacterium]|nr:hypothetical protein [Saprospiraceae bacterium]
MKTKTAFICQECGYASAKWIGRCPECESWNSLVEEVHREQKSRGRTFAVDIVSKPERLADVKVGKEARI